MAVTEEVKEITRKLTKVGNSVGVTIPSEVLEKLNAQQGDEVNFLLDDNGSITLKKKQDPINYEFLKDLDSDFMEGLQDLFDNYDDTLRNLADR